MSECKLVRDKIPQIIRAQGGEPIVRIAEAGEYRKLLRAKLATRQGYWSADSGRAARRISYRLTCLPGSKPGHSAIDVHAIVGAWRRAAQ